MKCPSCGSEQTLASPTTPTRCLDCGSLLEPGKATPGPPSLSPTNRHIYQTPYGKVLMQLQKSGAWAVGYEFLIQDGNEEKSRRLLCNLIESYKQFEHPSLPKLHSLDEKSLRCFWRLPELPGLLPLSSMPPPLESAKAERVVQKLCEPMNCLHQHGLAAFDLSPSMIFVTPELTELILVPSPWLASQVRWSPGQVTQMPFVAPELDQSQQSPPDLVRADIYGIGALAWFLLTGENRKQATTTLPSERSKSLISWDAFIDGCCRTNPVRRFPFDVRGTSGNGCR